jgi:hypothetical protein
MMKIFFQKNIYFTLAVFIFFFLALVYFSTNFDPAHAKYGPWLNLNWSDSYRTIIDREKGGDVASYMLMGKGFVEDGILGSSYNNYLSLWTPGLPALHALLILFFGLQVNPIPFFYFFLIIIWSIIFTKYFISILNIKNIPVKLILIILLFYALQSEVINYFFLKQGLIMSEGISSSIFILSLILLYELNEKDNLKKLFFAAIILTWSAITRATIDLFVSMILMSYFALLFFQCFSKIKKHDLSTLFSASKPKGLFIVIIMYSLLLLPYRILAHNAWGGINLVNPKVNWAHSWMPDNYLNSINAGWLISGGGNIPCHLNSKICDQIYLEESHNEFPYVNDRGDYYRNLTLQTIFENPWLWIKNKYLIFIKYWFSGPPDVVPTSFNETNKNEFFNLFTIFLLVFCFVWALLNIKIASLKGLFLRENSNLFYNTIIPISMIAAFILPQFFIHFEVRYFYPIKIYVFFLTISLITRQYSKKNNFSKFL